MKSKSSPAVEAPRLPRVRGRWVQVVMALVLLAVIGVAGYRAGVSIWTSRQYNAANRALERFDYTEAGERLDSYLYFYPTDFAVLVLAAQTARRRGDIDGAGRQLRLAETYGAPAAATAVEWQLLRVQAGDLRDAAQLSNFASNAPDGQDAALVLEALIEGSLIAYNPRLAKWSVETWLKHRRGTLDQAQGLIWRGRVSELVEDFPQARADYEKAAELAPDRLLPRLRLVDTLLRDDPRQAIPHIDWLRERRPDDVQVRFRMARLSRHLGQPEEADRLLQAILATRPESVPVLLESGRVALDLQRPADAEPLLRKALSLGPSNREVLVALADCLRQSGRLDEAKRHQDRALEIEVRLKKKLQELSGAKDDAK